MFQTQNIALQQTAVQQSWLSNKLPENNAPSRSSTANSEGTRRMSEPCHTLGERKSPPPRPASVTLSPLKGSSLTELHPNQAVVLDEIGEGEMVENKLVIPDEMVHYLNQVADNNMQWPDSKQPMPSPSHMLQSPQIMPSPSSNFNQMVASPQHSENVLSPASVPGIMPSPNPMPQENLMPSPASNMNQIIPSPATPNLNQMMHSPLSNLNQMMPSPAASNVTQVMHSPGSNMNQMLMSPSSHLNQIMPSPGSTINQMMPSPSSNYNTLMSPVPNMNKTMMPSPAGNQMVPSPAANMNQMVSSPVSNQMQPSPVPSMNQMAGRCHPPMGPNPPMVPLPMQSPNCNNMMPPTQMQQQHNMMMQNHQINQCYNRQEICYLQHAAPWESNQVPNTMCQMRNAMPTNMCHTGNANTTNFNNTCRPNQMQNPNGYGPVPAQNHCNNHSYQNNMCNNQNMGYMNMNSSPACQQPKPINGYCNNAGYPMIQGNGYGCVPNINEPMPSPTIATPAPSELISQQQPAQMPRPCSHLEQNCYRQFSNYQCVPNTNDNPQPYIPCANCNKAKPGDAQNKCSNNEIQCHDISQSQMSPGIVNQAAQNNGAQAVMRHDTYQRTLEYVQNCQSWVGNAESVTSSTHPKVKNGEPSSNMVVNDMSSSLSSLLEENRYLQMIQ